jgi:hypothetical protein
VGTLSNNVNKRCEEDVEKEMKRSDHTNEVKKMLFLC